MRKILITMLVAMGLMSCGAHESTGVKVLAPADFDSVMSADTAAVLLDVRTAEEFAEGHLQGAVQLDFLQADAFDAGIKKLDPAKHYYVYCRSGRRSHGAAEKMTAAGLVVSADMKGGILAWQEASLPITKEK